jgi:hypothetical protein
MHWPSPFFYIKAKFGTSGEKKLKTLDINRDEIFQNSRVHPFLTTKGMKKFWKS